MKDVVIRKATKDDLMRVQFLSRMWAGEKITYGYSETSLDELENYTIWVAEVNKIIVGYLGGYRYLSTNMKSIMPLDTACFEVEELYVLGDYRSLKIGSLLYDNMLGSLKDEGISFITLASANIDTNRLNDFYKSKDMSVFSTRFFKEL